MLIVFFLISLFTTADRRRHDAPGAPEKPATLTPGLGKRHHAIATRSAEAQQFFDQGLTLVYAFNHEEDVRALTASAPASERAYVDAIVTRYSNDPNADLTALQVRYSGAMNALVKAYPNDLDAATLYAESLMDLHPWRLWTLDGKATQGTGEIVAALESVLRRDSTHIGANHYYIHAVEASRTPDRALTSNTRAAEADRAFIKANGAGGVYPSMYYNHNLDFLASAAMMSGQFEEAKKAADLVVANTTPMLGDMPMLEAFGAKTLYVLLRFARWDEVMRLPQPAPKHLLLTSLWNFGRGVAQAARGNRDDAERCRAA